MKDTYIVTVAIKKENRKKIKEIVEKMIKLKVAENKNEAINILISYGIEKMEEKIKEEEKINELAEKWIKEGFPFKKLDTKDLREERYE